MIEVTVRPMAEADLDEADRIMRLAFGTFLRLPDPMRFSDARDGPDGVWGGVLPGRAIGLSG
jgi:hypothetical protein